MTNAIDYILSLSPEAQAHLKREGDLPLADYTEAPNGREQRHPYFDKTGRNGRHFIVRIYSAGGRLPEGTLGFSGDQVFNTLEEAVEFAHEINPVITEVA